MTRLATQAKNRLHAVLHRHHLAPPEGDPFLPDTAGVVAGPAGQRPRAASASQLRPGHPGLRRPASGRPSVQTLTDLAADEERPVLWCSCPASAD